jgi:hypothetical protein
MRFEAASLAPYSSACGVRLCLHSKQNLVKLVAGRAADGSLD